LAAQKRSDDDSQDDMNGLTRYGDEISLGTVDSRKQKARQKRKAKQQLKQQNYLGESSATLEKQKMRPWADAAKKTNASKLGIKGSIAEESSERENDVADDFFENNHSIFDRSMFNFNQSLVANDNLMGVEETIYEDQSEEEASKASSEADEELMQSLRFDENEFEVMESKIADKIKDMEAEFNEAWETMEADKHVAAQIHQRREDRLRNKANKKALNKAGVEEIPRLYLFEGEKKDNRRRKKKRSRRQRRKLDSTLSREFRRAMRDVFDEEPEDPYNLKLANGMPQTVHPGSEANLVSDEDSAVVSTHSRVSEHSEELDDGYLRRLKERSMQQQVKGLLFDGQDGKDSDASDDSGSDESLVAFRRAQIARRRNSMSSQQHNFRKTPSGRVRPRLDPVEVYAQEVKKQEGDKAFSVADLKKEMDDLRRNGYNDFNQSSSFNRNHSGHMEATSTSQSSFGQYQTTKKSFRNPPSQSGGLGMAPARPQPTFSLDRQTSVKTTMTSTSDQGLLTGQRRNFDLKTSRPSLKPTTIAEGDEDEEDDDGGGGHQGRAGNFFGGSNGGGPAQLQQFGTSDLPTMGDDANQSDTVGIFSSSFEQPVLSSDDLDYSGGELNAKSQSKSTFSLSIKPDISKLGRTTKKLFGKLKLPKGNRNRRSFNDGGGGMKLDNDDDMGLLG